MCRIKSRVVGNVIVVVFMNSDIERALFPEGIVLDGP
jgi:hypothetical protein